ncbi:ABC transporter permease [Pseudoflavonifractor sp. P01025]|uniref:ABC transporter permease n=1 Tax=Flintibacter porci TaxID=3342383 RepID=UPI0035B606E5
MEMDKMGVVTTFIHNIVVYNIPLLYGTAGEIMVEKSGSLNLGVEGIMAVGAIFGYIVGCYANSLGVGILMAFLMGALCGLLFAALTVSLQANQNITGLTLTTFGLGVYFFVGNGVKAISWPVMNDYANIKEGFANLPIPGLSQIPVLGEGLFNHNVLVYLGVVIALVMWWYLNRTNPGLRLRAVGENPGAADSVGVNVKRYKYIHICLGCGVMGIGGYYMALNMSGSFNSSCWINGYGWIAVALVIFANWNPALAILGTFVFGFFNTLRVSGSSLAAAFPEGLGWLAAVPTQLYQALPFIITAVVLVVTSVRKREGSGQPQALGLNYFREER